MTDFEDVLAFSRENWRVLLLVVLLLSSAVAIFAPAQDREGPTNLKFGLELDGGTRVRAPLVGMTAEEVDMSGMNRTKINEIEREVATDIGVGPTQVEARPSRGTVELFAKNVSQSEFRSALEAQGLSPETIRDGVTEPTRTQAKRVIEDKLRRSPNVTGASVSITQTLGGKHYIQVEVPGATSEQVLDIIERPGRVTIVAVYPTDQTRTGGNDTATPTPSNDTATPTNGTATPTPTEGEPTSLEFEPPEGYSAVTLLEKDDLKAIDQAHETRSGQPVVPVTLTDEAGQNFSAAMRKFGFTGEGVQRCRWETDKQDPGWCLIVVRDGEPVSAFSMGADLAQIINQNQFVKSDNFQLTTRNMTDARQVQIDLQAGALPTRLDFREGTITFVGPSQGERFKFFSLVTGVVAALAVSLMIFLRYREPKVALPMWLTALAEVFLLLGFAASISLSLDLAHIAGFIAAIGTGVDDLVIIADEVISEGDVNTRRVFQSRFKKAFWVIGAAALTTTIAMSPLMVLGLGDLSGFAIVTIVGVLIGVLVTRPAYGDVLRSLVTGQDD